MPSNDHAQPEIGQPRVAAETERLRISRAKLHSCQAMYLQSHADTTYKYVLSDDEMKAVKALVRENHLVVHEDAGPSVRITYYIVAGDTTWGVLLCGLVLDGETRETSESRRFRYEHPRLDFMSPGPADRAPDGRLSDANIRYGLLQLVDLYKRGELN